MTCHRAQARVFRISGFEKMLVLYSPVSSGVEIVRVIHGSRARGTLQPFCGAKDCRAHFTGLRRTCAPPRLSWRRGLIITLRYAFPQLLRRSRGGGRRLTMFLWGRCRSRCFLLLLHLLVMVLVLRGALGRLRGLGLWPTRFSRRSRGALRFGGRRGLRRRGGGGLRGVLCQYRQ